MVLALLVSGIVVVLVLLGLFVFGLRRRLIQRSGGTFDCSLRWNVPEQPEKSGDPSGKGWIYGVARYNGDRVEWFRVFSYAPRPRRILERASIEVLERRTPQGEEELALLSDSIVLACHHRGTRLELAMSEDALTGFLAWLEAAPPGQRVNVA
ncbi:DUF2550 domain-containing protein [Streptomyces sp. NPDC048483]|uniref:DUF2550 domain-containing protein n=1 Tax=Streptomyces sp. NPDC048483 TaxID=3154927 RepID=UPI00344AD7DC